VHHTAFRAPPGRRLADDEPIRWRSGDSNPRTQSRPAFIHAKASRKESFCSASALHDVASQAIKNLPHLQPMTVLPLNRSRWGRRWSSGHGTGTTHRLRYGQVGSSDHMWRHISGHVTAPDVDREVWPVLGKALSKQTLQEQAAMRQPTPPRRSKCSRCCRRPGVPSRKLGRGCGSSVRRKSHGNDRRNLCARWESSVASWWRYKGHPLGERVLSVRCYVRRVSSG
jgi:hypothetical protein